jgi:hypothetical protein
MASSNIQTITLSRAFLAAVPDVQVGRENAEGLLRGATIPFNIDGTPFRETTEFGVPVTPHFHDASQERTALATVSAWIDPESAAGYSFHGAHGGALNTEVNGLDRITLGQHP